MKIDIRAADIDADGEAMLGLLTANLNPRYDKARFDWLYRRNPDGPARAWVAVDTGTGEVVGTAAAVPRRVVVRDREAVAFVLSDFCMAPACRSLGPALKLQRACLALATSGEGRFCLDFPAAGMMSVYRRLGVATLGEMRRLSRAVRVDARVEGLGLPAPVSRALRAVGNALIAPRRGRSADGIDVVLHDGPIGAEFSDLDRAWAGPDSIRIRRSAEYLTWRFQENPFERQEVWTARRAGKLVGYAVVAVDSPSPTIVDLFGVSEAPVLRRLVSACLAELRSRGAMSVNAVLFEGHPWMDVLRGVGFRIREGSPVVLYAGADGRPNRDLTGASWLLTHGDRDA